jgi:hypothetical protein
MSNFLIQQQVGKNIDSKAQTLDSTIVFILQYIRKVFLEGTLQLQANAGKGRIRRKMIVQNLGLSAIKSGNLVTEHNFVKNEVKSPKTDVPFLP